MGRQPGPGLAQVAVSRLGFGLVDERGMTMKRQLLLIPAALMVIGAAGCGEKPRTAPPQAKTNAEAQRTPAAQKLPIVRYYSLPG